MKSYLYLFILSVFLSFTIVAQEKEKKSAPDSKVEHVKRKEPLWVGVYEAPRVGLYFHAEPYPQLNRRYARTEALEYAETLESYFRRMIGHPLDLTSIAIEERATVHLNKCGSFSDDFIEKVVKKDGNLFTIPSILAEIRQEKNIIMRIVETRADQNGECGIERRSATIAKWQDALMSIVARRWREILEGKNPSIERFNLEILSLDKKNGGPLKLFILARELRSAVESRQNHPDWHISRFIELSIDNLITRRQRYR